MAGTAPTNYTVGNVHVSVPLSQMSIGYHPTGMVAEQVMPVVPVAHENDLYYKWDKGQAFRLDRTDGYGSQRADKARPKMLNFGATLASYIASEFALETAISDRERANADSALALEISKTRRVQDLVLLDQEVRVATICLATANNSGYVTLSGANQWNSSSFASQTNGQHSVIQGEIETGKESIRKATGGLLPNLIVIPRAVAAVLYNDVGLFDIVKYTNPSLMVSNLLPATLWGMKVVIPTAVYQTTDEGEAFSGSDVWGKNVWMGYVEGSPGLDSLTFGCIFRSRPWQVKSYRDEQTDTTIYRPSIVQAEQLVASDCGYLIQSCIA